MYIPIERNSRGNLEITQVAFNKLLHLTVAAHLPKEIKSKDLWVETEIYQENLFYILIKITLPPSFKQTDFDEKKLVKQIENVSLQMFNVKPKNIAIAYGRH